MPKNKKQLLRIIRLFALLKANKYPNCYSFSRMLKRADLFENLNIACTPKTIYRDIKTLKNDFHAPIFWNPSQNGYYLKDISWEIPMFCNSPEGRLLSGNDALFPDVIIQCQLNSLQSIERIIPEYYTYKTVSGNSSQSEIHINTPIPFSYIVELIICCGGNITIISPLALKEKICKLATSIIKSNLCNTM